MDLDDLYSLYITAKDPRVDLLGVTVSGTEIFHFDNAAENAASILSLAGKNNIPISQKLSPAFCSARSAPGYFNEMVEAINSYELPQSNLEISSYSGTELIKKISNASVDKVTILALGSLTNVAHAISEHPSVREKIERVILLGGGLEISGISVPVKEYWSFASRYTLLFDPCAANIVLTSGIPITIIPLDVTNLVPLTKFVLDKYAHPQKTAGNEFVMKVLTSGLKHDQPTVRTPFWNMIALMSITDPSILQTQKLPVQIITDPGKDYGRLVESSSGTLADVCISIDPEKFYERFFSLLNDQ